MKNLVVCCDGTWNTATETERGLPCPTNVVKLYNALVQDDTQLAYYHPGVGTGKGWLDHMIGGGTGEGLDQNIMSAYRWLAGHYAADDRIFVFGFSRGAYTVRSLGGLIAKCGLLDLSAVTDSNTVWSRVHEVFAAYRSEAPFTNPNGYAFFNARPSRPVAETTPIHFIGVWDTVGALGIPDDFALLGLIDNPDKYRFHDTALSRRVAHARHAVALDERRASFAPTLWSQVDAATDVKQIWFPGAHSDVGGGYLETGLSDGALNWMMSEAETCGLKLRAGAINQLNPVPLAPAHNSVSGLFEVLKTRPRPAPPIPQDAAVLHSSVLERNANPPLTHGLYWPTTILDAGKSKRVDVFAVQQWNFTGLYLEAGCNYEFSASGQWIDGKGRFSPAGQEATGFNFGDVARFARSALGEAETAFKKLTGRDADFWWTRRDEDAPWFALLGFIANAAGEDAKTLATGETFVIGEKATFTPKLGGYLYCYANDAWQAYANNRGSARLEVTRAA
jgi:hypothetical protein